MNKPVIIGSLQKGTDKQNALVDDIIDTLMTGYDNEIGNRIGTLKGTVSEILLPISGPPITQDELTALSVEIVNSTEHYFDNQYEDRDSMFVVVKFVAHTIKKHLDQTPVYVAQLDYYITEALIAYDNVGEKTPAMIQIGNLLGDAGRLLSTGGNKR